MNSEEAKKQLSKKAKEAADLVRENGPERTAWLLGILVCERDAWRKISIGLFFLQTETVFFLKVYGWHWFAINFWEKCCDAISVFFIILGCFNLFSA